MIRVSLLSARKWKKALQLSEVPPINSDSMFSSRFSWFLAEGRKFRNDLNDFHRNIPIGFTLRIIGFIFVDKEACVNITTPPPLKNLLLVCEVLFIF